LNLLRKKSTAAAAALEKELGRKKIKEVCAHCRKAGVPNMNNAEMINSYMSKAKANA